MSEQSFTPDPLLSSDSFISPIQPDPISTTNSVATPPPGFAAAGNPSHGAEGGRSDPKAVPGSDPLLGSDAFIAAEGGSKGPEAKRVKRAKKGSEDGGESEGWLPAGWTVTTKTRTNGATALTVDRVPPVAGAGPSRGDVDRTGLGDAQFRRLTRRIDVMYEINRCYAEDMTHALGVAFQATGIQVQWPVFGAHSVYPPPDSPPEEGGPADPQVPPVARAGPSRGDVDRTRLCDAQFRRLTRRIDAMHDINRRYAEDMTHALRVAFQAKGIQVQWPVFGAHSVYPPPDSPPEEGGPADS